MADLTPAEARTAFKAALPADLKYTAKFVPWSRSRSGKGVKPTPSNQNLNWTVKLERGGQKLESDYTAGIAHIPGYRYTRSMSVMEFEAMVRTCETGARYLFDQFPGNKNVMPNPDVVDVVSSLLLDADVINYGSYEEWASDLGFDADSRSGEAVYKQCLETGLRMRRLFGDTLMTQLRELAHSL